MNEIASYLPRVLRNAIARQVPAGSPFAIVDRGECAAMLIDVSGYTSLTRRAVSAGPEAVERFNASLNRVFVSIIEHVHDADGDVVGFAGDAVLALFEPRSGSLASAALLAARCALACQAERLETACLDSKGPATPASTRITLGCGATWFATFGRPGRRQHMLAGGEALQSVAACQHQTRPETILATPAAEAALGEAAVFVSLGNGARALSALVDATNQVPADRGAPPCVPETDLLLPFLPAALATRLRTGHGAWMAEMRFVCPVFLSLRQGIDASAPSMEPAVSALLGFEDELLSMGGELMHVRCEEHGIVAVGMFGTPGCTHENDALRAVKAARASFEFIASLGADVDVGVSSGHALCSVYGNDMRRDYDVLGDVMNLAARLMQCHAGALCDQATWTRAGARWQGTPAGTVPLKGLGAPVEVIRLAEDGTSASTAEHAGQVRKCELSPVGRDAEHGRILDWLSQVQAIHEGNDAGALLIEGEAGMGKSTLVDSLVRYATAQKLACVVVNGSATENLTPFLVWRFVLQGIYGSPGGSAQDSLTQRILQALSNDARLTKFAPLLNEVLPLSIAANEITRQMEPSARATTTAELLLHLIEAGELVRIIVFEDAHWIDSASWAVIAQAARRGTGVSIVLTTRLDAEVPDDVDTFLASLRQRGVLLGGLSEEATGSLIARRLGAAVIAPEVARFVRELSGGNPFFIEELAFVLLERGQLVVEAGVCIPREGLDRLSRLSLPMTVRAAVLERIDRLTPRQQMLAKLASVVGSSAPVCMLRDLLPVAAAVDTLQQDLQAMEERALCRLTADNGSQTFSFRHAITREAVYGMLIPSQRRSLHRAVGEWYERAHESDRDAVMSLLAHHFRYADDRPRAAMYLTRAGEQALEAHANGEAVQFLSAALDLTEERTVPDPSRARLCRLLAEAHLKMSNLAASRRQVAKGLQCTGEPLRNRFGKLLGILGTVVAETLPGWRRAEVAPTDSDVVTAQLHQLSAEVAYFEHDALTLLHGAFACQRIASSLGPSRELATSHGTAAIVLGLLRLARASRRHLDAAERVAVATGHVPTIAYVRHLAGVCHCTIGAWDEAEECIEAAAHGYRRVGELYRYQSTRMILAYQSLHRGNFTRVPYYLAEAEERSLFPSGPKQLRIWFRTADLAAQNALAVTGVGPMPSKELVQEVESLGAIADPSQALLCRGFAADSWRLRGQWDMAVRQAELGLSVLLAHRPTTYYSLLGIASIAGTFLAIGEKNHATWLTVRRQAIASIQRLRAFSAMVPIARPSVHLLLARLRLLDCRQQAARRALFRSMNLAAQIGTLGVEAAGRRLLVRIDGEQVDDTTETGWA